MNPVYLHRTLRFIFVIGAVVAGAFALFFVSKVTYPFIIGFLIAFMMNPLVNFFQTQAKMPRALAVFISLLLIMLVFAGMVTLLVVEIASGAEYLAKVVPEHLITLIDYIEHLFAAQLIPIYNQLTGMFQSLESGQQDTIMDNIQNVGATIGTTAGNFIKDFFEKSPTFCPGFRTQQLSSFSRCWVLSL